MADKPKYSSIIDEFLDSREPDYKALGLKDAKNSGDEWLDRTHAEADEEFLDELAEGASKHTNVPPNSKGATLRNRLIEKENAAPRLGAGRATSTRNASHAEDYRSAIGDDESLVAEVTESIEAAARGGKVEKKNRSDAEIQRYVHDLLNQGVPPTKVAANLRKLAEIELFNHQMSTRYLQDNAGLLGISYLEPNQFMDKTNPNYERKVEKTAGGFNTQSELQALQDGGGILSQIRAGDRVTIRTSHGQELTGRAVMFNREQQCWVLNLGGRHGTPGIADETNIVKVRKSRKASWENGKWVSDGKTLDTCPLGNRERCDDANGGLCAGGGFDAPCSCKTCHSQINNEGKTAAMTPAGFSVGQKAWDTKPNPSYTENPPDDWEDCGQCGGCHPPGFTGDCREDINRWPSEESIAALTQGESNEPNELVRTSGPFGVGASVKTAKIEDYTPVIFRKWKDNGDVLALFPYDLGTDDPYTCSSYEHMGQHSAANPQGCIQQTLPCKPEEYAELKAELESLGYKLKPISRLQYKALLSREKQLKQYYPNTIDSQSKDKSKDKPLATKPELRGDAPVKPQPPHRSEDDKKPLNNEEQDSGDKTASSNDCVRQAKAWKAAGIQPRAKSVKQITACADCTYFKKNGSTKSCGLYGLPVVGNAAELAVVVNRMTAGVPTSSKRAALVQIANRIPQQNTPVKQASSEAPFVRQASFTKERQYGFVEAEHFSSTRIQKLHAAGHSLKVIYAAAEKKFGALETSKAIREFVASLRKEKGKIIVANADADFLKKMGIHNEAIVGAAKCASCNAHNGKELHKTASTEMITRAPEAFVQATPEHVRSIQKKVVANFDSAAVAKYHAAGHSVNKIYKAASAKYGSAQASKAVRDWANNLKNTNTKIALSQIDCTTLKKMGVKLSSKNAIIGAEKCGSCSYRNGMHCGLTGGTLLSFPGMNQIASNKKVSAGAPKDGRSMLKEFDLIGKAAQADINTAPPEQAEINFGSTMNAGDISVTAEWKGWTENMPVQVVGVDQNRITPNGGGYQEFTNLTEAKQVFPDLDPHINGQRFTWAMAGRVGEQPAIRFETWAANDMYSR